MYIYLVRRAVSHIRLLFCAFLRHSLIRKLFTNYSYSTQGEDTNRLATARTETTRGPTYSMARTIDATAWQKGFICRCHYLCCHSQWKSLVTWTDLSNGHIDEGYQERLAAETAQEREARQQHDRDRHSERSVQTKKLEFHGQIASLSSLQCTTSSEKFPGLRLGRDSTECMHCSQDKHIPKLYSPANNMDPGAIPPQQPVIMFHNLL